MKPFTSEWLTWGNENVETLPLGTDTTDTKKPGDSSNHGTDTTDRRHSDRHRLATGGTDTKAKVLPHATLTKADLKYALEYVEGELPGLTPACRERFDYWLDLIESESSPSDVAMRAAFFRATKPPRREYRGDGKNSRLDTSRTVVDPLRES